MTQPKDRAASRANTQHSSKYFSVQMRIIIILCFVYMLQYGESKSTTSYVLLSMNMMSTLNFEYEYGSNDINISINGYK